MLTRKFTVHVECAKWSSLYFHISIARGTSSPHHARMIKDSCEQGSKRSEGEHEYVLRTRQSPAAKTCNKLIRSRAPLMRSSRTRTVHRRGGGGGGGDGVRGAANEKELVIGAKFCSGRCTHTSYICPGAGWLAGWLHYSLALQSPSPLPAILPKRARQVARSRD